ncbi:hypothetical protein RYX36_003472 [Vicia faba]
MDANVITIENSISDEKLLSVFCEEVIYSVGIGPGVYFIHSPRIPPTEEICLSDFLSRVDVVNDHPWTPESRLVTGVLKLKSIYYTFSLLGRAQIGMESAKFGLDGGEHAATLTKREVSLA